MNYMNSARAQEIQLSALNYNSKLLKTIAGVTYNKLSAPACGQAIAAVNFMNIFLEGNDLIIWLNGLFDDLDWGEEISNRFEAAMQDLGRFLGFGSQRPESEVGCGPDNLWALGGHRYLVIECKSGATSAQKISKHDTNQLNGSIVWFEKKYDATANMTPIIVHQKTVFESAATPNPKIRIMNISGLEQLRKAVRNYAISLATSGSFKDARETEKQLMHHKLNAQSIVALCTVDQGMKER